MAFSWEIILKIGVFYHHVTHFVKKRASIHMPGYEMLDIM